MFKLRLAVTRDRGFSGHCRTGVSRPIGFRQVHQAKQASLRELVPRKRHARPFDLALENANYRLTVSSNHVRERFCRFPLVGVSLSRFNAFGELRELSEHRFAGKLRHLLPKAHVGERHRSRISFWRLLAKDIEAVTLTRVVFL
jgi:hypothetical protein